MFNKNSLNGFLIFFIILGVTLRSFYFSQISLAPTPLISLFFLFVLFFLNKNEVSEMPRHFILFISGISLFFVFNTITAIFFTGFHLNGNSFFGVVFNIILFFFVYILRNVFYSKIDKLKYVLYFHLAFFVVQLLSFHLFGQKIDYLESITGEAQRINGFASIEAGGLQMFRPAGLFNEPGNYSMHILSLLWLTYISKSIKPVSEKIILLSVVLSFSLSGIFCAIVYLTLTRLKDFQIKMFLYLVCFFSIFYFFFGELFFLYLDERLLNISEDNSANVRLYAISAIFELPTYMQIFGAGLGNDIIDIHLPTLPYIFITFGLIGSLLFSLLFYLFGLANNVRCKNYIYFFSISFQFYTVMHPLFWLFWGYVFFVSQKNVE